MKQLFNSILLLGAFFLVSCIRPPVTQPPAQPKAPIDRNYETRKETDKDREIVIKKARRGAECSTSNKCENICEDIYSRRSDRQDCEELSVEQVEKLEALDEYLEKPDFDDLQEIDFKDLDVYINVSIDPLDDHVGDWNKRETEAVLEWLATDFEVARIFEKEDDNYAILKTMLKEVGSNLKDALEEKLDEGTLLEIAIVENNENLLEWIHDLIEDEAVGNCRADDLETEDCLKLYCDLADAMSDEDTADDWLGVEYFERYLENLIDDGVNGAANPTSSQWDTDEIEDTGDLEDEWWEQLC